METLSSSWSTHQARKMLGSSSHRLWQPRTGMVCPVLPFEIQIPTQGSRGYPILYSVSPGSCCPSGCCLSVLCLHSAYESLVPEIWPEKAYLSYWFILWSPEKNTRQLLAWSRTTAWCPMHINAWCQFLQSENPLLHSHPTKDQQRKLRSASSMVGSRGMNRKREADVDWLEGQREGFGILWWRHSQPHLFTACALLWQGVSGGFCTCVMEESLSFYLVAFASFESAYF